MSKTTSLAPREVSVRARSDAAGGSRFAYVDGLRAIAVLAVVVAHGFDGAARANHMIAGFPANLGDRGVDLFFVISGFCLARPFLASRENGAALRIDFGAFIMRRIARIAPPYYVALTIFTVLSFTSFAYPTASGPHAVAEGLAEVPFDLLFLTNHLPIANPAFWTLGLEMRWYVLCPLLIAVFLRSQMTFALVIPACWLVYTKSAIAPVDLGVLPYFMLGVLAAAIDLSSRARRLALFGTVAFVPTFALACASQSQLTYVEHADPLWYAACTLLVVGSGAGMLNALLGWSPLVAVGRASYSIYLVHMPVIFWLEYHGVPWAAASLVGCAVGFAFWLTVERHFLRPETRSRIERSLASTAALLPTPPLSLEISEETRRGSRVQTAR